MNRYSARGSVEMDMIAPLTNTDAENLVFQRGHDQELLDVEFRVLHHIIYTNQY